MPATNPKKNAVSGVKAPWLETLKDMTFDEMQVAFKEEFEMKHMEAVFRFVMLMSSHCPQYLDEVLGVNTPHSAFKLILSKTLEEFIKFRNAIQNAARAHVDPSQELSDQYTDKSVRNVLTPMLDEAAKAEQCLREGEEALKGTKAKLASKLEGNADLLNKVKDYDEKSENLLKEQARLAEEQARLATQKRELNNELRVNATEVEILVNLKDKQVDAVKKCMQICGVKPLLQATAEGAIRVAISTFKDFEMDQAQKQELAVSQTELAASKVKLAANKKALATKTKALFDSKEELKVAHHANQVILQGQEEERQAKEKADSDAMYKTHADWYELLRQKGLLSNTN